MHTKCSKLIFTLLSTLLCFTSYLWAEPQSVIVCPKLGQSIISEDGYDHKAWSALPPVSGFTYGSNVSLVDMRVQTLVRVGWTNKSLLVSVFMHEPEIKGLATIDTGRDGNIWWDDSVEIFIDPGHKKKNYIHLMANVDGTCYDAIERDKSWNGKWSVWVTKHKESWVLEFEIPFKVIGVTPAVGDVWGVNFCRQRVGRNKKLRLLGGSWVDVSRNHHQPDKFGSLVFVNKADANEVVKHKKKIPLKNGKARVFLKDKYLDINKSGEKSVDYALQAEKEITSATKWVNKLKTLDLTQASDKQRKEYKKLMSQYDEAAKFSNEKDEKILQWVAGRKLGQKLNEQMKRLYWEIRLEKIYREIARD